jgi:molybdenum cofactor cytidylyltransferase
LTVAVTLPAPQVAVILAAGSSTRFAAGSKQIAAFRGRPLVAIAAQAALDAAVFAAVVVVAGAEPLEDAVPEGVRLVHNQFWESGQASSLQAGLSAARVLGAQAIVVGLADQPMVPAEAWRLVSSFETDRPIVVATYADARGNPVRLDQSIWDDLPHEGDEGARTLMRRRPELIAAVACPGDASDVDTVEDLERWN